MNPELSTEPTAPTLLSITKEPMQKKCKHLPIIIVLVILAVVGFGFGGYELYQNSRLSSDIRRNTAENSDKAAAIATPEGIYLSSDSFKDQRYRLAVVSAGEQTAFNTISSEDDSFYLLDMTKLGSSEDLRKIDLVTMLKPITDEAIKNSMPKSSENALGSVTNLSQCNSFSVGYYDPFSRGDLPESNGLNLEKDVPITVLYFCHTDEYQVAFYRAIYVLDVETNKISKFQYGSTSDFSK